MSEPRLLLLFGVIVFIFDFIITGLFSVFHVAHPDGKYKIADQAAAEELCRLHKGSVLASSAQLLQAQVRKLFYFISEEFKNKSNR